VDQALDRLRASGLVVWDPADLCMSSNVCRHSVQVQRLAALLSAPSLARTKPQSVRNRRKVIDSRTRKKADKE
jgi:hypothetical protein